jgi:hypothetical protein
MTITVNKHKEQYDVYIGRGSIFGNQFVIGKDGNRAEVIEKYRIWFNTRIQDTQFRKAVLQLKDKRLGCFCKPLACHGDIICEYINKQQ